MILSPSSFSLSVYVFHSERTTAHLLLDAGSLLNTSVHLKLSRRLHFSFCSCSVLHRLLCMCEWAYLFGSYYCLVFDLTLSLFVDIVETKCDGYHRQQESEIIISFVWRQQFVISSSTFLVDWKTSDVITFNSHIVTTPYFLWLKTPNYFSMPK